jgi:hypothetical protein
MFHLERFNYENSTIQQMSLEVFSSQFLTGVNENESSKIWILRGFDVHFSSFICLYEILLYAKHVDLLDNLGA